MNASLVLRHLLLGGICILSFLSSVIAQVNFSADTLSGCSPLVVNFNAQAPGAVDYSWDLGNGALSNLPNPGATYVNGGFYDITLTVSYSDGSTQTLTKPQFLEVFALPQPNFSLNPTNICLGESVSFSDLSQPGSGPITQWLWDFGDGNTDVLQSPTNTYNLSGNFSVTLVVTDANSCQETFQMPNAVKVNASPTADFQANNALSCTAPFMVNFFSTGQNLSGAAHSWDFGTGSPQTNPNPLFTYFANGSYTVTHIVSDTLGCSDTVTKVNYINIGTNQVSVQVSDSVVCAGETVQFFCGAGPGSAVTWNFGPGQGNGAGCNTSHTYNFPGLYLATADITDPTGCVFTASKLIQVNALPGVDFTVSDTLLCEPPMTTSFSNLTLGGGNTYLWLFGDGSSSTLTNPTHTYPTLPIFSPTGQPYLYDVTLVVTDINGCTASLTKQDYITTGQTRAGFEAFPEAGCAPLDVDFVDVSVSPSQKTSWFWTFGDGTTSTQQNPSHTYQDTGYYDVSLIITTLHGCIDTVFAANYVKAGDTPVADFMVDTTWSCASASLTFTNLSIGADSAFWSFGDGGVSPLWNPIYSYQDTGWMDVMLIAYDRGCPDTVIKPQYLFIEGPIAKFTPGESYICDFSSPISFTDSSIIPLTWYWDFGDGDTSNLQNPVHTYTQEGTFPIQLLVTNDSTGCVDSTAGLVRVLRVEADLGLDVNSGCEPLTVTFTDSSLNGLSFQWDYGNGQSNFTPISTAIRVYPDTGTYTVVYTVRNQIGCQDDTVLLNHINVYEPKVDFLVSDTIACVPEDFQFTNLTVSKAPIVNWLWEFGLPNDTSNLQDPLYTVGAPGSYTVSLTATDSAGCVGKMTYPDLIYATQPIPDFSVTHPINCLNNPISFTNNSTGLGLTYFWDFGDNTTSNATNPIHSYAANGVYDVSLTITDVQGCDTTLFMPSLITIAEPEVTLQADTTYANCPPLLVNFQGITVSPHPFSIWSWDFGDNTGSAGVSPSHVYIDAGTYSVGVIATTSAGCADTVLLTDLIQVDGPKGDFDFTPKQLCPGSSVTFSSTGTPNIAQWTWDFDNGVLGAGDTTAYTYHQTGVYYPKLILEDSAGCQVVVLSPDSVVVHPVPVADFGVSVNSLCDNGQVTFLDQSQSSAPVTQWAWDFGAQGTATVQNPQVFFPQPGSYDASLIVTTSLGCKDTVNKTGVVIVHASPEVLIGAVDSMDCQPFTADFLDLSPNTNSPIQTWFWDFGTIPPQTANSANQASFTYQQANLYTATLVLTDINGCTGTDQVEVEALPLPNVAFSVDKRRGCAPFEAQFTDLTPGSVAWQWNFGDASPTSALANPLHTYQQNGSYGVSLRVWDVFGCTDSLLLDPLIRLSHPTADFSVSDRIVCPNVPVNFNDLSQGDTTLSFWDWDFGDATGTANQQNPAYAFPQSGTYDISLTIEDVLGCRDSLTQTAWIEVLEDAVPEATLISRVSVLSDTEVEVSFSPFANTRNDFNRYEVLREINGNWQVVGSMTDINQTVFRENGLDTKNTPYCYLVRVVNYCETTPAVDPALRHCTVNLSVSPLVDELQLDWTPYIGWANVDVYRIYRVASYDLNNIALVAEVGGGQTSWIDSDMFCYDAVTYRVEAVGQLAAQSSFSNIDREAPLHFGPPIPQHMRVATVVDDQYVKVRWDDLPPGDNLVTIEVEKWSGNAYQLWHSQPISDPLREKNDFDTQVDLEPYQYRVSVVDTCGDRTPSGRIAQTILLRAVREGGTIRLNWNPYQNWENGIRNYQIEVFDETNAVWQNVALLPGNAINYEDRSTELPQPTYCYRVVALENGGNEEVSQSNEACVDLPPLLYFPNAFSPNNDQINDVFYIKGIFLNKFHLTIFSRWGKLLYESWDPQAGWDGTYKGAPAPEGVYVFQVQAIGEDGTVINRSGTVTLFR
ncbi:MAG: PKD domain-containing protein [Bacteroidota bacterium]